MLSSITWSDFITAIVLIMVGYYVVVAIAYYRHEILQQVNRKSPTPKSRTDSDQDDDLIEKPNATSSPIASRTLAESLDADQIQFGPTSEEVSFQQPANNTISDSRETVLLGTVSDLIQEIKTIIDLAPARREELVEEFQSLLSRYNQVNGSPYQNTINHYIKDSLNEKIQHAFSTDEVKQWWTTQ